MDTRGHIIMASKAFRDSFPKVIRILEDGIES